MGLAATLGTRFKSAFAANVVGAVSGALLVVLLARLLDPTSYGLLFLALAVFGFAVNFTSFGIAKSAARYISEFKGSTPGQIPHILRLSLLLNLVPIGIASLVFLFGHELLAALIGEPELSPYLLLGSVFIVFKTLTAFTRVILQGFEDIVPASILLALQRVGELFFAVGFVVLGYEVLGALVGYAVSYVLVTGVGLGYIYVRNYQPLNRTAIEPGLRRRLFEYSLPIAVTQTAYTLDHHIDKILVGFFIGPVAVAYYTIGKQVVQFLEVPMSALGFTLSPTYGAQKAEGNHETAARIYETALSYGLLLYVPAATGVILLASPGIEFVFGDEYLGAVPVLQILSALAVLKAVTKLTGEGLDYLGRARARGIIKGVTAVLNVVLNVLLIPRYGVVGAAVVTVVTFGLYTVANVYIMHLELDLRTRWLGQRFVASLLIAAIMAATVLPLTGYVIGPGTLVAVVGIGVTVWAISILALGLVDTKQIEVALR